MQRPNCSRKLCAERVAAMQHEAGTCREEFPVTRWSARLRKERSMFQPQRDDGTARDLVDRARDPAIFATDWVLKAPSFKGKIAFSGLERGKIFPASRGECHRSLFSSHHIILLSIFGARPREAKFGNRRV